MLCSTSWIVPSFAEPLRCAAAVPGLAHHWKTDSVCLALLQDPDHDAVWPGGQEGGQETN